MKGSFDLCTNKMAKDIDAFLMDSWDILNDQPLDNGFFFIKLFSVKINETTGKLHVAFSKVTKTYRTTYIDNYINE